MTGRAPFLGFRCIKLSAGERFFLRPPVRRGRCEETFPCRSVAALSTTCPHFCPRGLQVPHYCTLEPTRGWRLENPVPQKVGKVSPRLVRFLTLLINAETLYPPCAPWPSGGKPSSAYVLCCAFERSEGKEHLRKHSGYPRGL